MLYGKSGYFMVFLLYFLSLAIGNVAIGISAVGYLATSSLALPRPSPPASRDRRALADHGRRTSAARLTGKIGSITVWGVIIPVGSLSIIGWFWFSPTSSRRPGTRRA